MRDDEFAEMRAVCIEAFGDDESLGTLLDALRESWAWIDESYIAELDGEIVAQVLYTKATLDAPKALTDVLVLSPVGVATRHQGQGIGSHLIRTTIDLLAAERDEPLVFLEGSPFYYPRFGFRPGGDLKFRRPSLRIPAPAFQVYSLPNYDGELTGTLVYPDAFWRTDSVGLR